MQCPIQRCQPSASGTVGEGASVVVPARARDKACGSARAEALKENDLIADARCRVGGREPGGKADGHNRGYEKEEEEEEEEGGRMLVTEAWAHGIERSAVPRGRPRGTAAGNKNTRRQRGREQGEAADPDLPASWIAAGGSRPFGLVWGGLAGPWSRRGELEVEKQATRESKVDRGGIQEAGRDLSRRQ
ncbi:unnamed protein product [Prorocentrum cordatum]|uniref:Uncharacterized protein n=1 Tax=Prorocentrum cordatum TaxID=2364126 RepID=A0ABN9UZA8_9DINO|nr:unnamed protein product [Polarella glacialis]